MNIFDLIMNDKEKMSLNDIFLDEANRKKFEQLITEHKYIEELSQYGLPVNNKILLYGNSGCGKTMTAKARGSDDKDVGEMRRLVNTLIQLIDYFPEKALLLCATNHPEIIDTALLRRFQLQINFEIPASEILDQYYNKLLSQFPIELRGIERKYNISICRSKRPYVYIGKVGTDKRIGRKIYLQ